jgi:hypothetical protein
MMFRSFSRVALSRQALSIYRAPFVRSYISDNQVRKQYHQLFVSCDLDSSGYVTFDELHSTLFRFGLANLDTKKPNLLQQTFDAATTTTTTTTTTSTTTTTTTNIASLGEGRTDALLPEQFEVFIQKAVFLKTEYDNTLPEGKSPLWWRKLRLELRHYGSSFNLLYNQTKSAVFLLIDHGWRLSKQERKMVQAAVLDFLKTLPFAVLLAAPMGSLIVPVVAKFVPSLLPSAFHTTTSEDLVEWNKKDRAEKLAISSLEVASRILQLEQKLREASEGTKGT